MSEMIERVAMALWALETETDCSEWNELAPWRKSETYEKARAAIKAMAEWQPIETAPKDGTRIIVYRPNHDEYIREVGLDYWSVTLGNCWARSSNLHGRVPTRWQHLPEPPK